MASSEPPRVLLDSCALLAVIKNEPGSERLDGLMDMIVRDKAQLLESVLVLGEVYKRSTAGAEVDRSREDAKLGEIRKLLTSQKVTLLDVTPPVVQKATELRQAHSLKLPDAVHLATAILNRCDWFVTFDRDFQRVTGPTVFRLDRVPERATQLPWELPVQPELSYDAPPNVVRLRAASD